MCKLHVLAIACTGLRVPLLTNAYMFVSHCMFVLAFVLPRTCLVVYTCFRVLTFECIFCVATLVHVFICIRMHIVCTCTRHRRMHLRACRRFYMHICVLMLYELSVQLCVWCEHTLVLRCVL